MKNIAFAALSLAAITALGACGEEAATEDEAVVEATETESEAEPADAGKPADDAAAVTSDEAKPAGDDAGSAGVASEEKAV